MAEGNGVQSCYGVMLETAYIIPLTRAVILLRDMFHDEMIKVMTTKAAEPLGRHVLTLATC